MDFWIVFRSSGKQLCKILINFFNNNNTNLEPKCKSHPGPKQRALNLKGKSSTNMYLIRGAMLTFKMKLVIIFFESTLRDVFVYKAGAFTYFFLT